MYYAASGSIQDIDFSKIVGLDYASAQAYSEPIYCLGTTEGYINCIMGAWSPMSYLPESNKTGMKLENCDIRKWNLTEDWVRNTLERTTSHWGTSNVWTNITISEQQESVLGEVLKEYNVTYTVK